MTVRIPRLLLILTLLTLSTIQAIDLGGSSSKPATSQKSTARKANVHASPHVTLDSIVNYKPADSAAQLSLRSHRKQLHTALADLWQQDERSHSTVDNQLRTIIDHVLNATNNLVHTTFYRKAAAHEKLENLFNSARVDVKKALSEQHHPIRREKALGFLKALEAQARHRCFMAANRVQNIVLGVGFASLLTVGTGVAALIAWHKHNQDKPPKKPKVVSKPDTGNGGTGGSEHGDPGTLGRTPGTGTGTTGTPGNGILTSPNSPNKKGGKRVDFANPPVSPASTPGATSPPRGTPKADEVSDGTESSSPSTKEKSLISKETMNNVKIGAATAAKATARGLNEVANILSSDATTDATVDKLAAAGRSALDTGTRMVQSAWSTVAGTNSDTGSSKGSTITDKVKATANSVAAESQTMTSQALQAVGKSLTGSVPPEDDSIMGYLATLAGRTMSHLGSTVEGKELSTQEKETLMYRAALLTEHIATKPTKMSMDYAWSWAGYDDYSKNQNSWKNKQARIMCTQLPSDTTELEAAKKLIKKQVETSPDNYIKSLTFIKNMSPDQYEQFQQLVDAQVIAPETENTTPEDPDSPAVIESSAPSVSASSSETIPTDPDHTPAGTAESETTKSAASADSVANSNADTEAGNGTYTPEDKPQKAKTHPEVPFFNPNEDNRWKESTSSKRKRRAYPVHPLATTLETKDGSPDTAPEGEGTTTSAKAPTEEQATDLESIAPTTESPAKPSPPEAKSSRSPWGPIALPANPTPKLKVPSPPTTPTAATASKTSPTAGAIAGAGAGSGGGGFSVTQTPVTSPPVVASPKSSTPTVAPVATAGSGAGAGSGGGINTTQKRKKHSPKKSMSSVKIDMDVLYATAALAEYRGGWFYDNLWNRIERHNLTMPKSSGSAKKSSEVIAARNLIRKIFSPAQKYRTKYLISAIKEVRQKRGLPAWSDNDITRYLSAVDEHIKKWKP